MTSRSSRSTCTTSVACFTVTCRPRSGPADRWPLTSAPTLVPPSSSRWRAWCSPCFSARYSAWRPPGDGAGRGPLRAVMLSGASAPSFLLALLGILLLYGKLHLLPATGDTSYTSAPTGPTGVVVVDTLLHGQLAMWWDAIRHLILPAVCVALAAAVSIGRVLRTSLVTNLRSDYGPPARRMPRGYREGPCSSGTRSALCRCCAGHDGPPGRAHVRRYRRHRDGFRLARHRALQPTRASRRPTSRPSPG